jgi:hypothetical protein
MSETSTPSLDQTAIGLPAAAGGEREARDGGEPSAPVVRRTA